MYQKLCNVNNPEFNYSYFDESGDIKESETFNYHVDVAISQEKLLCSVVYWLLDVCHVSFPSIIVAL